MSEKLCIFDLDGTLLDTLKDLSISINFALNKNGLNSITIEQTRTFIGNGIKKLVERAIGNGHKDKFDVVFRTFLAHYDIHCNDNTKMFDGIKTLLCELKAAGYRTAIVSNKNDEAVQELKQIYFNDLIDVAYGVKEGMKSKPSPDTINGVIEKLNVKKDDVIYIGDSDVDMKAAINANVDSLIVLWGYRRINELNEVPNNKMIKTPDELLMKIKELKP